MAEGTWHIEMGL